MPFTFPGRSSDRRRQWTLAVAYTVLLASCDSPFAPEVEEVVRLEISPAVLQMVVGTNTTLTARVYGVGDELLPTARVFWSSQVPGVVTVNQAGVVTAVTAGTGQIAASAGGQSRTVAVTVSQPPITLIRITPPAGNVAVGGTLTLVGEALDGTGTVLPNRPLEWSSSAPSIATVSAAGVVSGVAVGQATISATGEGKIGSALITVLPSPIATITITPNGGTLPAGETLLLVATARDAAGQPLTGRTLEWRSSNDAVATVSASGLLTAISPGTVRITVSAPNGGPGGTTPTAAVDVTVLIEPVASALLVPASATLQVGQTATLTLNLFDAGGEPLALSGRTVVWSTGNATVATVNSSGVVTGVTVGLAPISATVTTPGQPGSVQATAQVTVSNQPVASVVVSPAPATVHVGYARQFAAVARNSAGQALPGRVFVWSSTNQAIASVDQAGLVTGVGQGTAQIRATSEGIQGVSTVTVDLVAVSSVSVTPATATIMPGQTVQLSATPRDSANNPITGPALGGRTTTWTSLNTAAATVSASGLVTAVAQGVANVSAMIGGTNGQSAITVNPLPSASQLSVTTQPSATVQNDVAFPAQPVIQLKDASGNNVSAPGVVIQAAITAPGTGALGGTVTATTNAAGAASFSNLKITGPIGARTLTFSSGALTPATSGAINVQPGITTQLVITAEPPPSASSGQAFSSPTVVQLRDVSGNDVPLSGVAITATPNPSAGVTLTGATTTTGASGAATFSALRLTGTSGSYTLTFGSGTLTSATSTSIALGPGSASRLALVQQPSPTAQNGVAFATQPVIQLVDGSGNPVAQGGVSVTAAIETGGGSLGGGVTMTTNASGTATFTNLAITGTVGARTLIFFASGYTTVSSNSIALGPGASVALQITTQPSSTAQSGVAFGVQPMVQLVDQSGNAVSQAGVAVTASVNGAGASLLGGATVNTNASGTAAFSGLGLSGTIGAYSLSFSSGGLTGATSSAITLAAGAAAQLTITTQPAGASSGSAFTTQPAIQVRDAQGNPVSQSGIVVTPSIASGGAATLLGGTASTDATGRATFSGLGLSGSVGNYTLGFAATSLAGVTSGTIALGPGAPAQLAIVTQPAGAASGAPFTTQPAIQVRDAQGNPVNQAGVGVTATVNGSGATLVGSAGAVTNGAGMATFTDLGLSGTPGTYTIDFGASGMPNVTSGSINLVAGAATQLTMAQQPSATAMSGTVLAQQPAVQLRDAGGNPVSSNGVVVSVAISTGGASLTGSTTATTSGGVATFSGLGITGTVGSYTLSFSAAGLTGTTSSSISVTAGVAAQLTVTTQPAGASSGSAFSTQPSVQLRDGSGNPVSQAGVTVTAAIGSGPGGATVLGSGAATTDGNGLATFSGLGLSGTAGTYTLAFSSGALPNVSSASFVLGPGAPAQLTIQTQPAGAVNGAAFTTQPAIVVRDAQTNPVGTGVTVSASVNGAGASLIGTTTAQTSAAGVATFSNLGLTGTAGNYTLDFSAAGAPNVTSGTVTLSAGGATQLVMATEPSGTVASGSALATAPAVRLRDAGGNDVSQAGVSISVTISPAGAALTGSTSANTDASGVATFTGLGITGVANNYTLHFASTGLSGTQSISINVTPGPAAQLAMLVQPPASSVGGAAFSTTPAVQLQDASNNPVSQAGITVTAAVTGGAASLVGSANAQTDASGIATFNGLGINDAGTWTIDFSSSGLASVTSSAVIVSAAPTQLGMVAEPSASAQNGQPFATQPSVRLLDGGGSPVSLAGVAVTAEITGGGATLFGTTTVNTDASGIASFTNLGINGAVSDYTLTFTSTGLTEVVSSTISLSAVAAAKLHVAVQPPGTASNLSQLAPQPVIQLRDAQDNDVSVAGSSVTATLNLVSGLGGSLNGTNAVATDGSGQAAYTDLSINGLFSQFTLTFSATGLASATSGQISITLFIEEGRPDVTYRSWPDTRLFTGTGETLRNGTPFVAENTSGVAAFTPAVLDRQWRPTGRAAMGGS